MIVPKKKIPIKKKSKGNLDAVSKKLEKETKYYRD